MKCVYIIFYIYEYLLNIFTILCGQQLNGHCSFMNNAYLSVFIFDQRKRWCVVCKYKILYRHISLLIIWSEHKFTI